jgi:DNA invertase Pin-like site-specific DNA recombinase
MTQPERWIAYIRHRSAGGALGRQETIVRGLIPAHAEVTVIVDVGGSGLARQPGLEHVLELVQAGSVAGVACVDLSRLSRSPDDLRRILADLRRHGVALVTEWGRITGEIDEGWFLEIQALLAEVRAQEVSVRIRRALARKEA